MTKDEYTTLLATLPAEFSNPPTEPSNEELRNKLYAALDRPSPSDIAGLENVRDQRYTWTGKDELKLRFIIDYYLDNLRSLGVI